MRNQIARSGTDRKQIVGPHEVEDLVQKWLKDLRRTRAPDTVSAYQDVVEGYYLKWLGRNGLDLFGVDPSGVEYWLDEMAKTDTKGTVAIRFHGVKSFYRYLHKARRIRWDPCNAVEIPRSQIHPKTSNRKPPTDRSELSLQPVTTNPPKGSVTKRSYR